MERFPFEKGRAAQRRPAKIERKNRVFFRENASPYGLEPEAFQTENALWSHSNGRWVWDKTALPFPPGPAGSNKGKPVWHDAATRRR